MCLKNKMENFNKRWNISSTDSYQEAFKKFKIRILNIFRKIDHHVSDDSITDFCQYYGIKKEWRGGQIDDYSLSKNIYCRLEEEDDEKEFYKLIELILSLDIQTQMDYRHENLYSKELLVYKVEEAMNLSDVNVTIVASKNEIILYPKGEKMLDNELVNNTLAFLNEQSNKHFKEALKKYRLEDAIKSAESLRRCLEEFLKFKLQNQKGLDANINELGKILKTDNRDSNVRNIIFQTFKYLDKYFNENSKHNDGDIDSPENEFLIYQAGLLMRYVNQTIQNNDQKT